MTRGGEDIWFCLILTSRIWLLHEKLYSMMFAAGDGVGGQRLPNTPLSPAAFPSNVD